MGQRLFNLGVTEYPELDFMEEELGLLGRLYNLYSDVIRTINEYEEVGVPLFSLCVFFHQFRSSNGPYFLIRNRNTGPDLFWLSYFRLHSIQRISSYPITFP